MRLTNFLISLPQLPLQTYLSSCHMALVFWHFSLNHGQRVDNTPGVIHIFGIIQGSNSHSNYHKNRCMALVHPQSMNFFLRDGLQMIRLHQHLPDYIEYFIEIEKSVWYHLRKIMFVFDQMIIKHTVDKCRIVTTTKIVFIILKLMFTKFKSAWILWSTVLLEVQKNIAWIKKMLYLNPYMLNHSKLFVSNVELWGGSNEMTWWKLIFIASC